MKLVWMKRGLPLLLMISAGLVLGACQPRAYRMVTYQPIDRGYEYGAGCAYSKIRYRQRQERRHARAERRAYRASARGFNPEVGGVNIDTVNVYMSGTINTGCMCNTDRQPMIDPYPYNFRRARYW